jgi:hypothetical protein
LLSASFALSEPVANRIAEDPTIKGKGKDGECVDYAIALSSKLEATGNLVFVLAETVGTTSFRTSTLALCLNMPKPAKRK